MMNTKMTMRKEKGKDKNKSLYSNGQKGFNSHDSRTSKSHES